MNRQMVLVVTGKVVFLIGVLMCLPIIVALYYQEEWTSLAPLLKATATTLLCGGLFAFRKPKNKSIYVREALAITGLSWLLTVFFGALPFIFSEAIPSFIDAIFESASGFTTTGSSILTDVEALPNSLLFWRSFSHFIGGMGVLVFALALIPGSSGESVQLMKTEMPGPTFEKVMSRVREVARVFYVLYAVFTIILIVILIIAGMTPFDAMIHAFGTAGTGGFSNYNDSVAHFNSVPIEIILSVGMLIFGVNFNIYFFALRGRPSIFLKSEDLRWYLGIIALAILGLVLSTLPFYGGDLFTCAKDALFSVSTIITTTGYGTVDFTLWPLFSQLILLLLMFIGGCAGSTAGGLKVSRILALTKLIFKKFQKSTNPKRVTVVMYEGKSLNERVQNDIALYFLLYIFTFILLVLLISFENLDFNTTFSSVAATFNNIGPGLGAVGPKSNFADFSDFSKAVFSFAMIAGRLEIVPLILLFAPSTWRP